MTRFHPIIFSYLSKKGLKGKYSSFTIAGSSIGVTNKKFIKWHQTFWDNLSTSIKLHKIKKLIVFNHRDCGAAKIVNGNKKFNKLVETKIHYDSFKKIKKRFKIKYPKLKIELILISLSNKIEKFWFYWVFSS